MDTAATPLAPPAPSRQSSQWREEAQDQLRGVAGAFLFGVPLIYTMEVWWQGSFVEPPRMLLALALTYAALVVLDRTVGFRARGCQSWRRALGDSAEALALGLLVAALSMFLLRRVGPAMSFDAILGLVILEAVPCSFGVGIANGLLQEQEGGQGEAHPAQGATWRATLVDAGATALGAVVIGMAIAPTDEIPMLAAAMTPPWLLALIATSLVISYIIVFEARLVAQSNRTSHEGLLQRPLGETVFSYLISLLIAALMLWFFGQLDLGAPWTQWLGWTIVMGLPATIGGAAGRLAV